MTNLVGEGKMGRGDEGLPIKSNEPSIRTQLGCLTIRNNGWSVGAARSSNIGNPQGGAKVMRGEEKCETNIGVISACVFLQELVILPIVPLLAPHRVSIPGAVGLVMELYIHYFELKRFSMNFNNLIDFVQTHLLLLHHGLYPASVVAKGFKEKLINNDSHSADVSLGLFS